MLCFRLVDQQEPASPLQECVEALAEGENAADVFHVAPASFALVPNAPFAYWVSDDIRQLFVRLPAVDGDGRTAKVGLQTSDDYRFVRLWWETPSFAPVSQRKWFPFAKGGSYSPFYADIFLAVNWENNGEEVRCIGDSTGIRPLSRPQSVSFYFHSGLTWPLRTQSGFSPRIMPKGCVFAHKGPGLFVDHDESNSLLELLAITSSEPFRGLVALQMAFGSYEVGVIQRTVLPAEFTSHLAGLASEAWVAKRMLDTANQSSHAFESNCLARNRCSLGEGITAWAALQDETSKRLALIQRKIDETAYRLYGIETKDRVAFSQMLGAEATSSAENTVDEDLDEFQPDASNLVSDLTAYCVGSTFGRWDLRCATGNRAGLETPDPFAPLPVCSPSQLQNAHGFPARQEDVPAAYPVRIPWDGILVDDLNHPLDIELRICEVIEIIWSGQEGEATAEAIEHEACEILGVKTLRDYFRKPAGFFAEHLKRYSKSRRQAPIYWQLSAGNGNYSAWLYYHRFTKDTLYRVLGDFVEPRIQEAEREQFEFESQGGLSGDAAGLLHEVQALLQDLRLFKSELELVAPLWNPNLNDGVIINHAILWRITPYTPWQKKCKECWDKLVKGDYDWAHLAFHLWPERVIRKCQSDRSLAIAHGLEERLWQETSKGSWLQRQLPEAELQALLAEYSKPAVQNALERFLAAPPPVAAARTRAPRAGKSSSISTTRRPRGSAPEVDAETSRQTLLVLTAAPADGLGRNAIAELLGVEAASLTAVIKQLKESGQIEQLGAARGAKYRLTEQGRVKLEQEEVSP